LAKLPPHLITGFLDALLERAQFPLLLLHRGPRIGKARTHRIDVGTQGPDIGLDRRTVTTQAPLLTLDEIDLLRLNAARQP
jgi:hypothetical protein